MEYILIVECGIPASWSVPQQCQPAFSKSQPANSFLVQQYVSDLYLTANWPATLFFFSTLHHTHHPPSRELVCNKSPLQCFYVTTHRHILDRHSSVTLVLAQCFKNIMLILFSFESLLLYFQGPHSQILRVEGKHYFCPFRSCSVGLHLHCSLTVSSPCNYSMVSTAYTSIFRPGCSWSSCSTLRRSSQGRLVFPVRLKAVVLTRLPCTCLSSWLFWALSACVVGEVVVMESWNCWGVRMSCTLASQAASGMTCFGIHFGSTPRFGTVECTVSAVKFKEWDQGKTHSTSGVEQGVEKRSIKRYSQQQWVTHTESGLTWVASPFNAKVAGCKKLLTMLNWLALTRMVNHSDTHGQVQTTPKNTGYLYNVLLSNYA